MTPAARYAAAIEILDAIQDGQPAAKCLTNWARRHRFAGSGDRAAIRDITFDCLRRMRSFAALSGLAGGRGLAAGHILHAGGQVQNFFTGTGYAPATLTPAEIALVQATKAPVSEAVRLDIPDWLEQPLRRSLGAGFARELALLQARAPVDLRVNLKKTTLDQARNALSTAGVLTQPLALAPTALRVQENPRSISRCAAYLEGLVELQDVASQAVVDRLATHIEGRVLDYCAGGGGKTLAMAAQAPTGSVFTAFDSNSTRMQDLRTRADRAGVAVKILPQDPVNAGKRYNLVLVDVPCSGTGAWRRNPDGKWKLSAISLAALCRAQAEILQKSSGLTSTDGVLAYVTCSMLRQENEDQTAGFLRRNPGWEQLAEHRFLPSQGGDGFYLCCLWQNSDP
jgi:16S rRNA (cytosine967-C5)-methyltransferase